jgi:hypothetical protein
VVKKKKKNEIFFIFKIKKITIRLWIGYPSGPIRKRIRTLSIIFHTIFYAVVLAYLGAKAAMPSLTSDYLVMFFGLLIFLIVSGIMVNQRFFKILFSFKLI